MNDSFHAASSILAEVTHIMDVVASFRDHPKVDHARVDGGGLGPLDHGQLAAPSPLHGGSRGRGGGGAWQNKFSSLYINIYNIQRRSLQHAIKMF